MIQHDGANPMSSPPAGGPQPGLVALKDYLIATYGGTNLGIYVDRVKRGGTTASLHRDGRALDWRHENIAIREAACAFMIVNADLLQIQAIHFYELSKIWTPYGWRHATGESFGETYAKWLHIERSLIGSADTRPINEILQTTTPHEDDEEPEMEYWKTSTNLYLVGAGDPIPVTGSEKRDYDAQRAAKKLPAISTLVVPDRWIKIAGPD